MKYCRAIASLVSTLSSQPSTPDPPTSSLSISPTHAPFEQNNRIVPSNVVGFTHHPSRGLLLFSLTSPHHHPLQLYTAKNDWHIRRDINREGERHGTASERRTNEQDSNGGGWLYWLVWRENGKRIGFIAICTGGFLRAVPPACDIKVKFTSC